ncbi:alpha/beta fold hydrolase [Frankia sp. AvcI1]|uniref:alpha/beta fold hydrolase n=1 Tax=Frankia sp. AvcI1 TaxID=573496 RepID=UPI002119A813|nr:alpha/beta hydrolase [Frankia sp. AvcI1]
MPALEPSEAGGYRTRVTSVAQEPPGEAVAVPGGSLWTLSRGSGPPMVLAHGGPGLSNNLEPVAGMVDDVARVHLYDQRGCGRSRASGPFDIATLVADLEALRTHWRHERWVVGGHSWGAALALFYALAHPDRTLGVIYLAGTAIRWGWKDGVQRERLSRLTAAERQELTALGARLESNGDERDRARFLRLMWSTDFASRAAATVLDSEPLYGYPRAEAVARAVQSDWKARLDAGIDDDLRRLTVPVLVVHGRRDPDPTGAREVADLAPRGRWVPLDNAGHSPWLERPAEMRQVLRAFLGSLS